MKKNTLVLLGGFIIAGAIVFLLMAATPGSSGVELTMDQLIKTQAQHKNDYVTVQGLLKADTIKWDADKIDLKFDLHDNKGNILHVAYHGTKPDNFTEGIIVILQGAPTTKDHFKAESVKTRCPSKYEGKDMKNYDPNKHKQYLDKPLKEK
jgi:cytochrome c-type biogenesis protein CcmE